MVQFGGSQFTGGGKRSTPLTVAWLVSSMFGICRYMHLPFGNMSDTSLYFVSWCWLRKSLLVHGPGASACADVQDLLSFG